MRVSPTQPAGGAPAGGGHRDEVHIIDGAIAVPIHEIDQAAADSLDRRDVQFHGSGGGGSGLRAQFQRARIGEPRIGDAKCHGAGAGSMRPRELLRKTVMFRVDDEVDVALVVQGHVLGAVARDGGQSHAFEQAAQEDPDRARRTRRTRSRRCAWDSPHRCAARSRQRRLALLCVEMAVPKT